MGRMTRKKAAEMAEELHVDEDILLEMDGENAALLSKETSPESTTRAPLGELEPNSADGNSQPEEAIQELKKSTRGRKAGKKAGKNKKNNLAASTSQTDLPELSDEQQAVLPDDNSSTPSPASEKAADDLMKDIPELQISQIPVDDIKPTRGATKAVKLTRSQLAKQAELQVEPKSLVDGIGQTLEEQQQLEHDMKEERSPVTSNPEIKMSEEMDDDVAAEPMKDLALDAPASPLPSAVPKVVANLRAETPAKRSTSNKENVEPEDMESPQPTYDILEDAAVAAATPESEQPQTPSSREDPIAALDALEEAVEKISNDIPDVQTSPQKPKRESDVKKEAKKAAPVVRTTKASQARISLAQNPDTARAPALGRPSPLKSHSRSESVRQTSSKWDPTASKRITSGSSSKDGNTTGEGEKKEVVIPHSKPRPISLSFPTPPPPAKSTKAPTQSTFQLPGEAVAAKLKAAREARMQKEAENDKKQPFKARPAPSMSSKPATVRHTNTSKARESIMTGKDMKSSTSAVTAAHKRANSVATTRPSAPKPRVVSKEPPKITTGRPNTDLMVKKRASTAMANLSKPRTSLMDSTSASTQRPPSNPGKGTVKGKEVFNRPAEAKAAALKEKEEREAAAKKARAEAAERGRQASRKWAEKQKKIAAAKKANADAKEKGDVPSPAKEEHDSANLATPAADLASAEGFTPKAVEATS